MANFDDMSGIKQWGAAVGGAILLSVVLLLNLGIAALRRWFQSRAQDLVLGVSGAAA